MRKLPKAFPNFRYRLCLVFLALHLCGCGTKIQEQQLVGRWVEDKESRRYEFTPNRLYAVVENGVYVQTGTWTLQGKTLTFRSLTNAEQQSWNLDRLDEKSLVVAVDKAQYRRFERAPNTPEIFDPRLVGLWRTDGTDPWIVEFTERGTAVGVQWRLDKVGGTPYPIGLQGNVTRAGVDKFYLDGFLGNARMKKVLEHPYAFEGERFHWGVGMRKPPPKVYRKIAPQDIVDLPQPTSTPPPLQGVEASSKSSRP